MELEKALEKLESKIDQLIEALQKAELKNKSLAKKAANLNNENISLLSKQKKTTESLKKLILKLEDKLL